MNLKLLLIIIGGIGALSYGVLSNDISLDVQRFDLVVLPPKNGIPIGGASEFSSIQCTCGDSTTACDLSSIGPVGTDLCTWPFPPP